MSASVPYRHFSDREALLDAVAEDAYVRLAEAMWAASDRHAAGTLGALVAIGRTYVDFARAEPHVFRLIFGPRERERSGASRAPATDPATADSATTVPEVEDPYAVLLRHVRLYLGRGADDPVVSRSAMALWMQVHGMSSLLVDEPGAPALFAMDIDETLARTGTSLLGAFV